jgi:TIR domain-containing protein
MNQPRKQTNQIFICYRRADTASITGRIYDRLTQKFGKHSVFKDVDSIPLGINFKQHVDSIIRQCAVVLVVIGDGWIDEISPSGKRKIDSPADHVRLEIESALSRDIPVVPLFVHGALMPSEDSLPESLRELIYRNGTSINNDPYFHTNMDRLIHSLQTYLTASASPPAPAPELSTGGDAVNQSATAFPHEAELPNEAVAPQLQQSATHFWVDKRRRVALGAISLGVVSLIVLGLLYLRPSKKEPIQNAAALAPIQSPSPTANPSVSPNSNKSAAPSSTPVKKTTTPPQDSALEMCIGKKMTECERFCMGYGEMTDDKAEYCRKDCRKASMRVEFRKECIAGQ